MLSSAVKTTELRISHRALPRLPREVCVIDSVWSCIVGNLKNEQRFIDQDGLFNLLEVRTTEFGFASPNCPKSPSNLSPLHTRSLKVESCSKSFSQIIPPDHCGKIACKSDWSWCSYHKLTCFALELRCQQCFIKKHFSITVSIFIWRCSKKDSTMQTQMSQFEPRGSEG